MAKKGFEIFKMFFFTFLKKFHKLNSFTYVLPLYIIITCNYVFKLYLKKDVAISVVTFFQPAIYMI